MVTGPEMKGQTPGSLRAPGVKGGERSLDEGADTHQVVWTLGIALRQGL